MNAMELVVQLVLAVAVFGVTLSGGSLVWPRITSAPRPKLLAQIHDSVVKTQAGAHAAQVLGVSDEKNIQPINLGEIAGGAVNAAKNAAAARIQTIIMAQVTDQLTNRYNNLSKDQQHTLQQIICKPTGVVK